MVRIVWSPVNQAWFVLWGDRELLRIFNDRADAEAFVEEVTG